MLSVQHLSKSYGVSAVLADITFTLNAGERVGLIGPNGSGKSTLLRCLAGREAADSGSVVLTPNSANVGYLAQSLEASAEQTVGEWLEAASVLTGNDVFGGYDWRLGELGLHDIDVLTPIRQLSGGEKTRLGLAALVLREPDLLLLDEPTNHLDAAALQWLEAFVVHRFAGALLVVSHDRAFLDATVQRILYLDPSTRTLAAYRGGYAEFATARAHERDLHMDAFRRQQEYVSHVRSDIGRLKSEARSIENSTTARQPGLRKFARRKAAVAKSRERKLERYLASEERVERPKARWPINLDFGTPPPAGRALLRLEDVSFTHPGADAPLLEHVSFEVRYGQKLAVIGANGAGKRPYCA